MGFVLRALASALGLWLASEFVPGVSVSDWKTLAIAAVLLGVVNALVRPVVVLLTLPLTLLTLGLFLLLVNAAMIGLVAMFLPGFEVDGLVAGVLTAIVTGVVGWIASGLIRDDRERR